jgi:NADH:ubiquinone oxidoreductase subunit
MAQPTFFAPFVKLAKQVSVRGWKGTMQQLYVIGDIKFGELKGTDRFGNKYYEDLELPYGQHRWIEYADIHNPDATMIQPEWHGWMHHMFDETPDEVNMKFSPLPSAEHADTVFDNHVGKTNKFDVPPSHDTSQYRQRGYKVGSLHTDAGEADNYYLQPGHALSPLADKGGRFKHRKETTN